MLVDGAEAVGGSVVVLTTPVRPPPVSGLARRAVRSVSGKEAAPALVAFLEFLEVSYIHVVVAE
jgi:hypothetical protein